MMQTDMISLDDNMNVAVFEEISEPAAVPVDLESIKPKQKKKKDEAMEGRVVFVDAYRHVIGIERDGISYQVCVNDELAVGDKVKFTIKNGAVILK